MMQQKQNPPIPEQKENISALQSLQQPEQILQIEGQLSPSVQEGKTQLAQLTKSQISTGKVEQISMTSIVQEQHTDKKQLALEKQKKQTINSSQSNKKMLVIFLYILILMLILRTVNVFTEVFNHQQSQRLDQLKTEKYRLLKKISQEIYQQKTVSQNIQSSDQEVSNSILGYPQIDQKLPPINQKIEQQTEPMKIDQNKLNFETQKDNIGN